MGRAFLDLVRGKSGVFDWLAVSPWEDIHLSRQLQLVDVLCGVDRLVLENIVCIQD